MREINFRAWDIENKIMVYDNENDTYGYWDGCQDSDLGMINHLLNNKKEYIFMQYTGLEDKNGKKIYERDIIIAHDTKFIIKYGEYRTELFDKEYKGTKTKQFGWYAECIDNKVQCNLVVPNDIEIIGNIYEDKNEKDR